MSKTGIVLGIVFVLGLFVYGIAQSQLPHSTLVGAATQESSSQQDINLCMNACMNSCARTEDAETFCLDQCEQQCRV